MRSVIERLFNVTGAGSTIKTELAGGTTTFITMSYIIFVQPAIMTSVGMDFGAVTAATCIASCITIILMGLTANYPFALAPGMGLNVFFVFTVCLAVDQGGVGFTWQEALSGVFWAGILFLIAVIFGLHNKLIDIIPNNLKLGISAGIGLLITMLGLEWAGIIIDNPATFVGLGDLRSTPVMLSIFGLLLTSVLLNRKIPGAVLLGILITSLVGIPFGILQYEGLVSMPPSIGPTFFKLDLFGIFSRPEFITVILLFFFIDIFDTMGTLVGLSSFAGYFEGRRIPRAGRALGSDATGTIIGALLGTSTLTSYLESATGITAGARTGLANMATGILMLASLFFYPLVRMIGGGYDNPEGITLYPSIAPVLIIVGSLIVRSAAEIEWKNLGEAIPAFLTIIIMPTTFSITDGLAFGFISYAVIMLVSPKWKTIHPAVYILAILFILRYILL
ncbi:NCS2 family permease [candidate division KSB1 bacterium]